jgi:hypothetical protein
MMTKRCFSAGCAPHLLLACAWVSVMSLWQPVSLSRWLAVVRGQTLPAIVVPCTVQEHKNIPYIVGELGLSGHELHWGLDPESGVRPVAVRSCCAVQVQGFVSHVRPELHCQAAPLDV